MMDAYINNKDVFYIYIEDAIEKQSTELLKSPFIINVYSTPSVNQIIRNKKRINENIEELQIAKEKSLELSYEDRLKIEFLGRYQATVYLLNKSKNISVNDEKTLNF